MKIDNNFCFLQHPVVYAHNAPFTAIRELLLTQDVDQVTDIKTVLMRSDRQPDIMVRNHFWFTMIIQDDGVIFLGGNLFQIHTYTKSVFF